MRIPHGCDQLDAFSSLYWSAGASSCLEREGIRGGVPSEGPSRKDSTPRGLPRRLFIEQYICQKVRQQGNSFTRLAYSQGKAKKQARVISKNTAPVPATPRTKAAGGQVRGVRGRVVSGWAVVLTAGLLAGRLAAGRGSR